MFNANLAIIQPYTFISNLNDKCFDVQIVIRMRYIALPRTHANVYFQAVLELRLRRNYIYSCEREKNVRTFIENIQFILVNIYAFSE